MLLQVNHHVRYPQMLLQEPNSSSHVIDCNNRKVTLSIVLKQLLYLLYSRQLLYLLCSGQLLHLLCSEQLLYRLTKSVMVLNTDNSMVMAICNVMVLNAGDPRKNALARILTNQCRARPQCILLITLNGTAMECYCCGQNRHSFFAV